MWIHISTTLSALPSIKWMNIWLEKWIENNYRYPHNWHLNGTLGILKVTGYAKLVESLSWGMKLKLFRKTSSINKVLIKVGSQQYARLGFGLHVLSNLPNNQFRSIIQSTQKSNPKQMTVTLDINGPIQKIISSCWTLPNVKVFLSQEEVAINGG